MSEQHSQKQGLKSSAQKEERAREGYAPLPASNPVAGAFGDPGPKTPTDQDIALEKSAEKNEGEA